MAAVWRSALPSDEKFVALALADFADDAGRSIFPSQRYIGWKVGKTDRAVRDTLAKLKARGILQVVGKRGSGPGYTIEYRFLAAALPARPEWSPEVSSEEPGDDLGGSLAHSGRKSTSGDPLEDPSEDPLGHSARARANPRGEQIKAAIENGERDRKRAREVKDRISLAFRGRRGNSTQRSRIDSLVRMGLTDQDVDHAIEVAQSEERDDALAYAVGVMVQCVNARKAGEDPHAGRTRTAGTRGGRPVRRGGPGERPGYRGGRAGGDGGAGAPAIVRQSDEPRVRFAEPID